MNNFFADSMLGKLSRFLRFFGYDTMYRRDQTIEEMLQISAEEDRVVLSQSKEVIRLCSKLEIKAIRIPTTSIQNQLKMLSEKFDLSFPFPPKQMRCSICNGNLEPKSKEIVLDKIPKRTAQHYDEFWQCEECSKIYWVGSHWKDINQIISKIRM